MSLDVLVRLLFIDVSVSSVYKGKFARLFARSKGLGPGKLDLSNGSVHSSPWLSWLTLVQLNTRITRYTRYTTSAQKEECFACTCGFGDAMVQPSRYKVLACIFWHLTALSDPQLARASRETECTEHQSHCKAWQSKFAGR